MRRKSKTTEKLERLAAKLEETGHPIVTGYGLWQHVQTLLNGSAGDRRAMQADDYGRYREELIAHGLAKPDRDYPRALRVLSLSDVPAEDAACLVDPTVYVSHLAAMQRWGLTDRQPKTLLMTRPDRAGVTRALCELAEEDGVPAAAKLVRTVHPPEVRKRPMQVLETKSAGSSVRARGSFARVATVGQTFLDTVLKPDLCGGMAHVLDVWEEHARTFLDEAVRAVDETSSAITKSRAGYILDERLGVRDDRVETWKALGKRGGSRLLDPTKPFAPNYSEAWMLSLNA